jgi:putative oxidoreductase
VNTGLLLLRLGFAFMLVFGHATQKLFAWPEGAGLDKTGELFEAWGHHPGKTLAGLAALCELLGGLLLAAGFLTPLGAAIVLGTMIVAAAATANNGLWNLRGGSELALVYALIAASLGFIGPGSYSLDNAFDLTAAGNGWGLGALAAGGLASALVLFRRHLHMRAVSR